MELRADINSNKDYFRKELENIRKKQEKLENLFAETQTELFWESGSWGREMFHVYFLQHKEEATGLYRQTGGSTDLQRAAKASHLSWSLTPERTWQSLKEHQTGSQENWP